MILVVGLSHKTAPIAVRETVAVSGERVPALLADLHARPEIAEVFVVSTCNRVEIYAASAQREDHDGSLAAEAIESVLAAQAGPDVAEVLPQHLFRYVGGAAVRHLFRVAASLDSLVVGEAQVLGQVKNAFDIASEAGTIGPLLGRATDWAFHVAKRVRSETQVGFGSVSVSSVAVELARQIFGSLDRRIVTLVGAGTMAEAAAKHLCSAGARLVVVNRSPQRGQALANRFEGISRSFNLLVPSLVEADVVIASTGSPQYVIRQETLIPLQRKRRGRSLFVIDIAVPRNVDPKIHELDGVYLYDIDDLSQIANETIRERFREAQLSERIVAEEAEGFDAWLDSLQVTPTIVAFRDQIRKVLESELERSLHGKLKHLDERDRKALRGMLSAATKKLAHEPTVRLKSAAAEGNAGVLAEALQHLFDLDPDEPPPSVPPMRSSTPTPEASTENTEPSRVLQDRHEDAQPEEAR